MDTSIIQEVVWPHRSAVVYFPGRSHARAFTTIMPNKELFTYSKSCIRLSMSGSAAEATDPTLTVKFWGNRFRVAVEASEDV